MGISSPIWCIFSDTPRIAAHEFTQETQAPPAHQRIRSTTATFMTRSTAFLLFAPLSLRTAPEPVGQLQAVPVPIELSGDRPARPPNMVIVPVARAPGVSVAFTEASAIAYPGSGTHLVPLFLLTSARREQWTPYMLLSYDGTDLLYVALPGPLVKGEPQCPADWSEWAEDLAVRHRRHSRHVANHQCWFRNLRPGLEIEHKFTLQPGSDIWRLAVTTHQEIRAGALPGWVFARNDGGLRAKDLCRALNLGEQPRHIEGMRSKLKRLVGRDILIEPEPGLFAMNRREG